MLRLLGKPFGVIGERNNDCDADDIAVPEMCASCRQLKRWTGKILSWSKNQNGPFAQFVRSVLKADDDILQSLCGFCFLVEPSDMTPEQACKCKETEATSLGISLNVPVSLTGFCDTIFSKENIFSCSSQMPAFDPECFDVEGCFTETCGIDWLIDCGPSCDDCVPRTLDVCGSEEDLALLNILIDASRFRNRSRRSGSTILESLSILFAGSTPRIIRASAGVIDVWIGRPMTAEEFQLRDYFKTLLPVNKGTSVRFVHEC